jgi:hypothetical protein
MRHLSFGFFCQGYGELSTRHAKLKVLQKDHKMKINLKICIIALVLTIASSPLQADKGKTLYEDKCTRCHSTELFTREDRSVKNLEVLKTRVKVCSIAAETEWADDKISNVVDYLNKNFYKF